MHNQSTFLKARVGHEPEKEVAFSRGIFNLIGPKDKIPELGSLAIL
jgi:hypothetical protein